MKRKTTADIIENNKISNDIYSMRLKTEIATGILPGQFIGVYTENSSRLLPRPISICEADEDEKQLRLVYRVSGKGTADIAAMKAGDKVHILGILGNGYCLDVLKEKKDIVIMAGGIGVPPMLGLVKSIAQTIGKDSDRKVSAVLGYRDSDTFLMKEFEKFCEVYVATDDGSLGYKGNVIDAMREYKLNPDIIFACGPLPMLKGIKSYADNIDIPAYISLEERMACGVGACLGCVCKTVKKDSHSNVNNARICTDGPVFLAAEVDI